jgi:amino acid permease
VSITTYLYLDAIAQALTASAFATLVFGGLSWLVERLARRRIGFYVGFVGIVAVAYFSLLSAYWDVRDSLAGLPDWHGWGTDMRIFYVAQLSITIPLLILSEIKLLRWSRNRALLTH